MREKLKSEIDKASWDMISDHHKRGAVFIVKDEKLEVIGEAIALDHVNQVKLWLDNKQIEKLKSMPIDSQDPTYFKREIEFLIIQPYVLIKLPL